MKRPSQMVLSLPGPHEIDTKQTFITIKMTGTTPLVDCSLAVRNMRLITFMHVPSISGCTDMHRTDNRIFASSFNTGETSVLGAGDR